MQMYIEECGTIGIESTNVMNYYLNFVDVLWMRVEFHL